MKSLAPDLLGVEKLTHTQPPDPGQLAGAGGRFLPSLAIVFSPFPLRQPWGQKLPLALGS